MFEPTGGTRDLLSSEWKIDLVDLLSGHETA
jgi:hypothetical protein